MHTSHAEPGTARRPARVDTVDTPGEFATIGHMRGWCHDTSLCEICRVTDRHRDTQERLERMRIAHRSEEMRRVNAQMDNAYLARELARAQGTLDTIISG